MQPKKTTQNQGMNFTYDHEKNWLYKMVGSPKQHGRISFCSPQVKFSEVDQFSGQVGKKIKVNTPENTGTRLYNN